MGKGGGKSCETRSNRKSKERTEIKFAIVIISCNVKVTLWGENLGSIVFQTIGPKELVGKYREFPRIKSFVLPVAQRDYYVDEHDKADPNVDNGKPRSHQRATMVGRDARPI